MSSRVVARASLIFFALLAAGCPEKRNRPCAPSLPSKLEFRDGAGQLELAVKDSTSPGASDLCDANAQRIGVLAAEGVDGAGGGSTITLLDGAGRLALRLRQPPNDDPVGDGPSGARLRLHREGAEWRVLAPDGVPFGSIANGAAFDKAGRPLARAEARGADFVLRGPDGATRGYVVREKSPAAAAAFALPDLSAAERCALALFFSRF